MKIKINKQKKQMILFTVVVVAVVGIPFFIWILGGFSGVDSKKTYEGEDLNLPDSKNEVFKNKTQIHSLVSSEKQQVGSEDLNLEDVYEVKKAEKKVKKQDNITNYDSLVYQAVQGGRLGGGDNTSADNDFSEKSAAPELTKREQELLAQKKILEGQLKENQRNYASGSSTSAPSNPQPKRKKLSKKERMQRQMNLYFQKGSASKNNVLATQKQRIPAYITHTQGRVFQGDRVQLRLEKRTQIKGRWFPVNTIFYGFIGFGDHRLFIRVSNIERLSLSGYAVYDGTDGSKGVFVKGRNLLQELKQYTRAQAVQSGEVSFAGATTTAQIINGAKGLVTKKMQKPSVTIHNGTRVYLVKD